MNNLAHDDRTPERRRTDENIAAEPRLLPPVIDKDSKGRPLEELLRQQSLAKPIAVAGIVDKGVVRPLDPAVKLTEHARVIIVTVENPSTLSAN